MRSVDGLLPRCLRIDRVFADTLRIDIRFLELHLALGYRCTYFYQETVYLFSLIKIVSVKVTRYWPA